MIDLQYEPDSLAGPVDLNVVRWLEENVQKLDPAYLEHEKKFHGGIPGKQYFELSGDQILRVGRFLTLLHKDSKLSGPFRRSWQFPDRDIRLDRSVVHLIDEASPTYRQLFTGEVLLPFAALYQRDLSPDDMRLTEAACDLLCFDYQNETPRPAVVVWDSTLSAVEYSRWEKAGDDDPVRYADFTTPVAENFDAFLKMLRKNKY